jgi:hypothetical protein
MVSPLSRFSFKRLLAAQRLTRHAARTGERSGGEGFAYALQAQGRAVVVGQGTGGGAHPTQPYPVAGGFVLMVPWGESISPITGTNWEGIGVIPDVPVPADEALETAHRLAIERLGVEHSPLAHAVDRRPSRALTRETLLPEAPLPRAR